VTSLVRLLAERSGKKFDRFPAVLLWVSALMMTGVMQGLKWGRVARVGDPAPFDLPGL